MKKYLFAVGLLSLTAAAQQPATTPRLSGNGPPRGPSQPHIFISSAEITQRIADADAAIAAGKMYSGEPLLYQDGHRVTMEWRNIPQNSVHAHLTDAEMFVILEGSGTLTLGGKLDNPTLVPAGAYEGPTLSAKTATGGTDYKVSKGDMIMIPENTAHTVSAVNGKLVLWSMIMPRPAPAAPAASAPAADTPAH